MAGRRRAQPSEQQGALPVEDYRHAGATRPNNPPAAIAAEGRTPPAPRTSYAYSPRLDPSLRADPSGRADALPPLLEKATREKLTAEEAALLAEALRRHEPWLEWAGKRETPGFAVDPVALHIHERVSTQAILRAAARQDVTRDLFADPSLSYAQAVKRRVFALQSRHALFPQVFRVVEEYVRRKVDFNGAPEPELGLEKYARQVVERVRDAIQPDDSSGEPPLLPLLNRTQEIGSTAGVEFRTKRPVFATMASHIGHVVADTAAWEQSAAFRLEQAAQQGVIRFYARNEGMDLSIPYEFLGVDHGYEPDFLIRMATPDGEPNVTLVLEVKGFEDNQTTAKHEGARRWVRAVNNWRKLGRWAFHVCRNPQMLERELAYLVQQWGTESAA